MVNLKISSNDRKVTSYSRVSKGSGVKITLFPSFFVVSRGKHLPWVNTQEAQRSQRQPLSAVAWQRNGWEGRLGEKHSWHPGFAGFEDKVFLFFFSAETDMNWHSLYYTVIELLDIHRVYKLYIEMIVSHVFSMYDYIIRFSSLIKLSSELCVVAEVLAQVLNSGGIVRPEWDTK